MSRLRQALQRVFGATPTPSALRPRTIDTNFSIIRGTCVAPPLPNIGANEMRRGRPSYFARQTTIIVKGLEAR